MTTAQELALLNQQLELLYTTGVEEWSESSERVRKLRFESLTARKDQLETKLAQEQGGIFRPIQASC